MLAEMVRAEERGNKMNEKSVLVIDTPKSCAVCPIFQDGLDGYCPVALSSPYNKYNERDKHCPLRPLPEKMDETEYMQKVNSDGDWYEQVIGWNACIKEIEK